MGKDTGSVAMYEARDVSLRGEGESLSSCQGKASVALLELGNSCFVIILLPPPRSCRDES